MKITLNQDPSFPEPEVIINCPQADEDILRLVAMLRIYQRKLLGVLNGEQHLLDVKDILYIDTTDKKTFLYTETAVYESALRLYELEDGIRDCLYDALTDDIIDEAKHNPDVESIKEQIIQQIRDSLNI